MNDKEKLQSFDEKLKTLNALVSSHNKALKLEFALMLQNEDYSALQEANNRLAKTIDAFRGKLHDEWVESAEAIRKDISAANRRLQEAIKEIEKKIKTAQNVVKAIGYIDRIVESASKVLARIP